MGLNTAFFDAFNIEPNDPRLYERALCHRSYVYQRRLGKKMDQQERLEFFGDSVLKFVVSYFLMHIFPNMEEGVLTKIRSRIISDRALSELALKMGLDQYVLISDSERGMGGETRPSLLANTLEAIIGALYLDKGADITLEWFSELIETHFSAYLELDCIVDYKTYLQEIVQRLGQTLPKYDCIQTDGPEHQKTFKFLVTVQVKGHHIVYEGMGRNKKIAQQEAAKGCVMKIRALNLLDQSDK